MQEPLDPFVVTVIPAQAAEQTTVADVIIGSFGITGILVLLAVVLGFVMGGLRVGWLRRHPPTSDHLPPVAPITIEPTTRSSSRARSAS